MGPSRVIDYSPDPEASVQLIHGPSSRSPRPGVLLLPGEFLGKGTGTLLALQQQPRGPGAQGRRDKLSWPCSASVTSS